MSRSGLSYALSREIDDFCRGSATDGTEFWVSVVSEPVINDKHMTEVNVRLAQETAEGLEPLGRFTIKCWPSVLDEFDLELMKHETERPDWILVVYECRTYSSGKYSRRMKVHDTRAGTMTKFASPPEQEGPSKPVAAEPTGESSGHASLSSERGQPQAGEHTVYNADGSVASTGEPPAACSHTGKIRLLGEGDDKRFQCTGCGERVG